MIDIVLMRRGNLYVPFSDYDRQQGLVYPENKPLRGKISGASKIRSYRHLCTYFGSCEYIGNLNLSENLNTKEKVDHLTRLKCGFVSGTVFGPDGSLQWIVRSLSYDNCDSPDAVKFINNGLEVHADYAGAANVDEYINLLNSIS